MVHNSAQSAIILIISDISDFQYRSLANLVQDLNKLWCVLQLENQGGNMQKVASMSGKIWKQPYCVEYIGENYINS